MKERWCPIVLFTWQTAKWHHNETTFISPQCFQQSKIYSRVKVSHFQWSEKNNSGSWCQHAPWVGLAKKCDDPNKGYELDKGCDYLRSASKLMHVPELCVHGICAKFGLGSGIPSEPSVTITRLEDPWIPGEQNRVSFAGKMNGGMMNWVQNRNRNSEEKGAFQNVNKIIAATLTDGFPSKHC